MILSTNQELGEYELIKQTAHVEKVWSAVHSRLDDYWDKFVAPHRGASPAELLAEKFGGKAPGAKGKAQAVASAFSRDLDAFAKQINAYRDFFDLDTLDEYRDDPNSFKHALSREVPVIARTLQQRRAALQEWQQSFRAARSKELLEVFINVISFYEEEWGPQHSSEVLAQCKTADDFGLDPLDGDKTMTIPNVIGMGIKSIVLYHLDPSRLPARGQNGLYGFYFLSGGEDFGLPSRSSEFLMVNDRHPADDGSIIMDQNYWYPYGLYSLYSWRLYHWLKAKASNAGYTLDPHLRFVFTDAFLGSVCVAHKDHLGTMRAHERFGG